MGRNLRVLLRRALAWCFHRLKPRTDPQATIGDLRAQLRILERLIPERQDRDHFSAFMEFAGEWIEARLMSGAGPWLATEGPRQAQEALTRIGSRALGLKESEALTAQGAFGDIELALQNVEWRREINLSWLEFSRWGIQQIILISRLYYVKNPLIQRAIELLASYIFARGVEVTSDDPDANDTLVEFFERNKVVLGPTALASLDKRLSTDGQVFFTFFADKVNTGLVTIRTIDATEIQQVVTNPEDTDEPWFYERMWTQKEFDESTGAVTTSQQRCWYPALYYEPDQQPEKIGGYDVMWKSPVYHFKGGVGVSKWHFDVPRTYAALTWARTSTKWLEWCATVAQAHAQIAWEITTKGGQQALEGIKQQLQTNVSTAGQLWDTNPTAVTGSIVGYGPGTKMTALQTRGAGGDPAEVKEYRNMVGQCYGIPPTWLGDLETANLATATTLDRPTETGFISKQENWRSVLLVIATYVLKVSKGAASGRLREAMATKKVTSIEKVQIHEAARRMNSAGRMVYEKKQEKPDPGKILVRVTFPAIREGDIPALVKAVAEAMTLDNKGGQIVGIDEKTGVRVLLELLSSVAGIEDPEEILDSMFPENEYDPDRTKEPVAPPILKAQPDPGGAPQLPGGKDQPPPTKTQEAIARLIEAGRKLKRRVA